jgi:tetratricopeptide (TPR) repeat protein
MIILKGLTLLPLRLNLRLLSLIPIVLIVGVYTSVDALAKDNTPNIGNSASGNYLAGRHAHYNSNSRFAIKYYRTALKETPKNIDLLHKITTLLVSEGDIDEALPETKRLVKLSNEAYDIPILILSIVEIKNQKYKKALEYIEKLKKEGLNTFSVPLLRAWLLAGQKKFNKAIKIIDQKSKNKGTEALFGIHGALISELAGKPTEAIKRYQTATNLRGSTNLRSTTLVGNLYERQGQGGNAKMVYDRYNSLQPGSTIFDSAYKRLISEKKPEPNITIAEDGVAEALFSLASAVKNQNPFQALIFLRLAVYLRPSLTIANLLLAELLDRDDRLKDANLIYRKIVSDPTYNWMVRLKIADNIDGLGDTDAAIEELQIMAAEDIKKFDALIEIGNIFQRHKRYQESIKPYEEAKARISDSRSEHWSLYYSLGISYERIKKWPMAEKNFLKALNLRPNHPSVLNYLGYSWVEQGLELDRAQKMIRSAVKQRPRDGYIIDSLGWVLYRLGNFEGAVKQLERAVQIRPEDPTINDHLGDIYWAVGRKNEATFQWKRALTLEPEMEQIPKIKLKLKNGLPENANRRKGI